MRQTASAQVMHRLRRQVTYSVRNPEWLVMDCFSRFTVVRELSRKLRKPLPGDAYHPGGSPLAIGDIDQFVADLDKDGLALGLRLPDPVVRELVAYARTATGYGDGMPQFGFPLWGESGGRGKKAKGCFPRPRSPISSIPSRRSSA